MKRLNETTGFSGFVTACRLATWPTRISPSFVKATTEGVRRLPSWLGMTTGVPPSITATTELVVPRSMPITLPIASSRRPLSRGRHWISRPLPGLDAALERPGVHEASRPIPCRLTGGRVFSRSRTIEDDLPFLRECGQPRLQLRQRDAALELQLLALHVVAVGADEERVPRRHLAASLLDVDARDRDRLHLRASLLDRDAAHSWARVHLRESHRQHAVLQTRVGAVQVEPRRQRHAPSEASVARLDEAVVAALVLSLFARFAADDQALGADREIEIVTTDTWDLDRHHHLVVGLMHVDGRRRRERGEPVQSPGLVDQPLQPAVEIVGERQPP